MVTANLDQKTVEGFGKEWSYFTQEMLNEEDKINQFNSYFAIFPWDSLAENAVGADMGCGSGRWATLVAPRVTHLHLVDASAEALNVAKHNLCNHTNVTFHHCSLENAPITDHSLDFAYSLGVLHHMPNTQRAIADVAKKIRPGGIIQLYLYYAFDNRPFWFRMLWMISNLLRQIICRFPFGLRNFISQIIAYLVYWPLARSAYILEKISLLPHSWPLSAYKNRTFYSMKTDALDRFGTRLEHRFTRVQIKEMLEKSGFERIQFSDTLPHWCVIGFKS